MTTKLSFHGDPKGMDTMADATQCVPYVVRAPAGSTGVGIRITEKGAVFFFHDCAPSGYSEKLSQYRIIRRLGTNESVTFTGTTA